MCALWGEGSEQPLTLSAWPQERYYVLYIRPSRIHRRKFDPKGNEIEPNFSATRKVNTGFLMSSYSRYPLPFLPRGRPTLWPSFASRGLLGATKCLLSMIEVRVWSGGHLAGLSLPSVHSEGPQCPTSVLRACCLPSASSPAVWWSHSPHAQAEISRFGISRVGSERLLEPWLSPCALPRPG